MPASVAVAQSVERIDTSRDRSSVIRGNKTGAMKNTDGLIDVRDCTTSSSGQSGHVFFQKVNIT